MYTLYTLGRLYLTYQVYTLGRLHDLPKVQYMYRVYNNVQSVHVRDHTSLTAHPALPYILYTIIGL